MKKLLATLVGGVVTCASLVSVNADTFNFASGIAAGADWYESSTWSKTGSGEQLVPGEGDHISLSSLGGARTVTLGPTTTIKSFSYNDTNTATIAGANSGLRILTISDDLTKNGSGSMRFTNTSGGNFRVYVDGNVVVNEGSLSIGTSGNAASLFRVSGSTIINSGLLYMRISGGASNNPVRLGATSIAASGSINFVVTTTTPDQYIELDSLSGEGDLIGNLGSGSLSATLKIGMSSDSKFDGRIRQDGSGTGAINLVKSGVGTLTLAGTNTHTGSTTVSEGTLVAENDHAFGLGVVSVSGSGSAVVKSGYTVNNAFTVDGGRLTVNGGISGDRASVAFGASGGRLTGSGTVDAAVALNHVNQVLSPGSGVGELTLTKDQQWSAFTYDWGLNSWDDSAANSGTAFSQIVVDGAVNLTGATNIVLSLQTFLHDGSAGGLSDFTEENRSWVILSADSLNSFNSAIWTINTDGFENAYTGIWSIGSNSGNVILSYQVVPEPGSVLLLLGGAALCLYRGMRRK